jgi:hypothetical protein
MNLKRKKHLYNFSRPPTNSNDQSTVSKELTFKKSSGYNLIAGKIPKKLPIIGIRYLTQPFNAVLIKGCFPAQWKFAQIILISKPGNQYNSYPLYQKFLKSTS